MFSSFLTVKIVKIMMICTVCGLETIYLKQHMSIHTDQRLFECDKCDKTLTSYKSFMNHKKEQCVSRMENSWNPHTTASRKKRGPMDSRSKDPWGLQNTWRNP